MSDRRLAGAAAAAARATRRVERQHQRPRRVERKHFDGRQRLEGEAGGGCGGEVHLRGGRSSADEQSGFAAANLRHAVPNRGQQRGAVQQQRAAPVRRPQQVGELEAVHDAVRSSGRLSPAKKERELRLISKNGINHHQNPIGFDTKPVKKNNTLRQGFSLRWVLIRADFWLVASCAPV